MKIYFKIISLFIIPVFSSFSLCFKDYKIEGELNVCVNQPYTYNINYNNVGNGMFWEVGGGRIVAINGEPIMDPAGFGTNITKISNLRMPGEINDPSAYKIGEITLLSGNSPGSGQTFAMGNTPLRVGVYGLIGLFFDQFINRKNDSYTVTVIWDGSPNSWIKSGGAHLGFLNSICAYREDYRSVSLKPGLNYTQISSNKPNNTTCLDKYYTFQVPWSPDASYYWDIPDGVGVQVNGNVVNVRSFSSPGTKTIRVSVVGNCGQIANRSYTLNIQGILPGDMTYNGQVINGEFTPGCNGDFNLNLPYLDNDAIYRWEFSDPLNYASYPLTYDNVNKVYYYEAKNVTSFVGNSPYYNVKDITGSVSIKNICGGPYKYTFIVKALQIHGLPQHIQSCDVVVDIPVQVPSSGITSYSWWSTNGGYFSSTSASSARFVAPGPGSYNIYMGANTNNGCYTQRSCQVYVAGSINNGNGTGWMSGILSDQIVGSGTYLSIDNNDMVYFGGKDGKIYYYQFETGVAKWVLRSIPNVADLLYNPNSFQGLEQVIIGNTKYIYYVSTKTVGNNTVKILKYVTADGSINQEVPASENIEGNIEFDVDNSNLFFVRNLGNQLVIEKYNIVTNITEIFNNNISIPYINYSNGKVYYIRNNTLFMTEYNGITRQISPYNDVINTSKIEVDDIGNVYYVSLDKSVKIIDYLDIIDFIQNATRISAINVCNGEFTINKETGVNYYVGLDNNIYLTYKNSSNIYATKRATLSYNDYAKGGLKFKYPHLYYISTALPYNHGNPVKISDQVWNLYFYEDCTPNLYRGLANNNPDRIFEDVEVKSTSLELIVHPNPVASIVKLNIPFVKYSVIAASGVEVQNGKGSIDSIVDVSNLPNGVYLIVVSTENNTIYKSRFVKVSNE